MKRENVCFGKRKSKGNRKVIIIYYNYIIIINNSFLRKKKNNNERKEKERKKYTYNILFYFSLFLFIFFLSLPVQPTTTTISFLPSLFLSLFFLLFLPLFFSAPRPPPLFFFPSCRSQPQPAADPFLPFSSSVRSPAAKQDRAAASPDLRRRCSSAAAQPSQPVLSLSKPRFCNRLRRLYLRPRGKSHASVTNSLADAGHAASHEFGYVAGLLPSARNCC